MGGDATASELPKAANDVSVRWLERALGIGRLARVEARPLGSIEGFTGQVARLALSGDPQLPSTLIAKFPNADPQRRALFHRLGYAALELSFYRTIAPRIELRVPRLYFGAVDQATGDSILLLEDLGAAHCLGSTVSDCSYGDALDVMRTIARFHSVHWGSVEGLEWIPEARLGALRTQEAFTDQWWPAFSRAATARAPELFAAGAPLRELGELLCDTLAAVKKALSRPPTTVVHFDLRVDNIFRTDDGRIAVIDWENLNRARGAYDVGYFAITSLRVQTRRQWEGALLDTYRDALTQAGVGDYTAHDCLQDYCLGIVHSYVVAILGVVMYETMSKRDPGWTLENLRRIEAACRDRDLPARVKDGSLMRG